MLLKEIHLQANGLSDLFNFYKDILELPVEYTGAKSIRITAGHTQLNFDETRNAGNPFYHFAFNIPSNKFEEAFNLMKEKVKLLWLEDYKSYIADFTNWNAKSFYFEDPAGNILEMISRFDLNDFSNEPFSSRQIRNISEMGLVFPEGNFNKEVNDFLQKFELSYFDKQQPMAHFRAVGDDEGLFIIVPENRVWFASKDKQAKILPMQIQFILGGEMQMYSHE